MISVKERVQVPSDRRESSFTQSSKSMSLSVPPIAWAGWGCRAKQGEWAFTLQQWMARSRKGTGQSPLPGALESRHIQPKVLWGQR